ncbi:MAG: hypothetical protein MJE66_03710 [Proteobacteria bacterium]|nr:hypothetical protein [Pseudomonadota bacterium]
MRAFVFATVTVASLALLPSLAAAELEADHEILDIAPEDRASFGMRNVFAPITGLFLGGPGYWYEPREVTVDTTPPGAYLDIFYIRSNFQKRYEQAESPVTLVLPPRIEAGPRDAITIRAYAEGFRQQTVTLPVKDRRGEVVVDLEPLPNMLAAVGHRYFAGRASLQFLTKEALTFRIQEAADGFSVVLVETGKSPEADATLDALTSPILNDVEAQQLGEDLMVRFGTNEAHPVELRSRQFYDAARDLHGFGLDLVPRDGGAEAVSKALAALRSMTARDATGCALAFDKSLRASLDPAALSRALTPTGQFTDRYVRAAMRRLGEIAPGGIVAFTGGTTLRPAVPIELDAALSQAADAEGLLAVLRAFVAALESEENRDETLRSLIAPELDAPAFETALSDARTREQACRRST